MTRPAVNSSRVWAISRTLMRGNRVLLGLLLAWPCALSLLLLAVSAGRPDPEDTGIIVQQELFYGLVLVALGSSVALGNELRAHRVWAVLGRAVSRSEYLLALYGSAIAPFCGYLAVLFANVLLLRIAFGIAIPQASASFAAELCAGLAVGAAGVLASVLLPQVLASIAAGAALAVLFAAGRAGFGVFALGERQQAPAAWWLGNGALLAVTLLLLAVAAALFRRRNLQS